MEKHIKRLSEEQRLLGVDVRIIYSGGDPTDPSDSQVLWNVNLRRIRPQALRDLLFYVAVIGLVLRRRLRADVVHVHGDWSAFLFGSLIKYFVKARLGVATVHGATRKSWGGLYKWILKDYGLVMATGARDAAFLNDHGVTGSKWQSSGIDPVYLEKAPGELSFSTDVIIVGNFYPVKNLSFAVQIARAMPESRFLFVGDGPEQQALVARCADQKIMNVSFAGKLPPDAVAHSLRQSRVLLSTSLSEGTPTAVLEAMACGLPIVTSNSNDYDELIRENINGYVIKGFAVSEYVRKLESLLSNESVRRRIALQNFSDSKKYGWGEVARRITESIHSSLKITSDRAQS